MFLTLRSISVFLIRREIIQKNKKPGCLSSGFAFFMGYIDGNRFISLCTYRKCLKPLADSKWLGKTFFDWVDYLTSNISLPIGGLMIAILSSWIAWPQIKPFISGDKSHLHCETVYTMLRWSIAIFAPILVLTVLLSGI